MINNYTTGDQRITLSASDAAPAQAAGAVVLDSRRSRPLYFDGRFLAARDLARDQNYFLTRQADLARAAGFGVIHGLQVSTPTAASKDTSVAETIIVSAGQGITPAGELVMLPKDLTVRLSDLEEEQKLDLSFGLSRRPVPPARTRTGLYVLALRPVEFTANPISSYPTNIQGNRGTHDGDIVEATSITLVPYPNPVSNVQPSEVRAALAQRIFLNGSKTGVADGLLPLALISIQRGVLQWVDMYLVRRETGPQYSGLRFGLTDPATQQAYLMQYDAMLQETLASRSAATGDSFSASTYFRALPPCGRFPLAAIDVNAFSQVYFPAQMDVRLSLIPEDELPALLDDSMSLPPIDLTLPAGAYADLAVFVLIPVVRANFAALVAKLTAAVVPLQATLPQVLSYRQPLQLLNLYKGTAALAPPTATVNNAWRDAIGPQTLGFYMRRRSAPTFVSFTTQS
jgi:hypothetical protein